MSSRIINPRTNRLIKVGGGVYRRLVRLGEIIPHVSEQTPSPKKESMNGEEMKISLKNNNDEWKNIVKQSLPENKDLEIGEPFSSPEYINYKKTVKPEKAHKIRNANKGKSVSELLFMAELLCALALNIDDDWFAEHHF